MLNIASLSLITMLLFAACLDEKKPVSPENKPEQITFSMHTANYFIINTYVPDDDSIDFLIFKSYHAFDFLFDWGATTDQDVSLILREASFVDNMVFAIVTYGSTLSEMTTQSVSISEGRILFSFTKTDTTLPIIVRSIAITQISKRDFSGIDIFCNSKKITNPSIKIYD